MSASSLLSRANVLSVALEEERFQRALAEALEKKRKEIEEYEVETRSCYRCGGFYSHATKEDNDNDTGYCSDCLSFHETRYGRKDEEGSSCGECGVSTQGRKIRGLWNNTLCEECGKEE
jgi:hypothetical protein